MLKIVITGLLILGTNIMAAQRSVAIAEKNNTKKNWNRQPASTQEVGQNILAKYNTDGSKVRAIYDWVVSNIKYDDDSARIINAGTDPDARVTVAFKRRKGVCENFAAIFV